MLVARQGAHWGACCKRGAAGTSSCPLSRNPGRRPCASVSLFRSRFEFRRGVLLSLLAHLVWVTWAPLASVFKASLRVQRTSPPVCVPDSSACTSRLLYPSPSLPQGPVSSPTTAARALQPQPGVRWGGGERSRAARCYWARRVDLRLRDQHPAGLHPPAQMHQESLSTFSSSSFISNLHGRMGLGAERTGLTCRPHGVPWVLETRTAAKEVQRPRSAGAARSLSSRG